ncbi:putative secreted signaling factor WNT9 [Daphnia pulex]|uniref:Protein Wnt n=1 Tax=Daphnia pulex TaxID=6669 RepID=E9G217_DAPPU|nr:putative secreted signaling factor WNT9 [Daphnia pulex]|eukprot:EFX86385.1 putative secreted signaling factor WNT9 [Daphnia pulex]
MCVQGGDGLAETLLEAIRMSVYTCQQQFEYERWNCTPHGHSRMLTLKKAYKETAALYAFSAAGVAHAVARACAAGRLRKCHCAEWRWGGCGDNLAYGRTFATKFLDSGSIDKARSSSGHLKKGEEERSVVEQLVKRTCKCHGVSGSCSVKTCWNQLAAFSETAAVIKNRYDNAVQVNVEIRENASHLRTVSVSAGDHRVDRKELIYQQRSPDFCVANPLSPGTTDRQCLRGENCDILCCGRGYNVHRLTVSTPCKCKLILCCQVECQNCLVEKTIHTCK